MADIYTRKRRSAIMSRIRSVGTKPEKRLYELIREAIGTRRKIQQNVRSLPGCPDIFIPSLNLIIFCDGCFYHSCPQHGHTPKSNVSYWSEKFVRNRKRDRINRRLLRKSGYVVVCFWEHNLRISRISAAKRRIKRMFLKLT
jgi:DNA mismatch endonuclease (patch repair protein)